MTGQIIFMSTLAAVTLGLLFLVVIDAMLEASAHLDGTVIPDLIGPDGEPVSEPTP